MADVSKLIENLSEADLDKLADKLSKSRKGMKSFSDQISKSHKGMKLFADQVNDLSKSLENAADEAQKIHFEKGMKPEVLADFVKEYKELSKEVESYQKKARNAFDPDEIKKYMEEIKKTKSKIDMLGKSTEATFKTGTGAIDDMAEGFGDFGRSMKKWGSGNRQSMKEAGKDMVTLGGDWTKLGSRMAAQKGIVKGVGTAMAKLGPVMQGIGAKMLGPAGIIYSIVKGAVDMGMAMDQYVKDVNKTFAMIRGPDITTTDVKKQFQEFNNMIYNTGENIRVGLDAKQITGFFEAIGQAGMSIQQLNLGLHDYRDAIFIASKASKTLGVDLPYVASLMEDMIMNFRMNLDQVDKAFVQVSFDAKKSGLSTDRFWTAIKNATASLSMYGNFISSISKQLPKFARTGAAGMAETADAVQTLGQMWKGMSDEQRASVVALGGNLGYAKKRAEEMRDEYRKKASELGKEVEVYIQMREAAVGRKAGADELAKIDDSINKARIEQSYNMGLAKKADEAAGSRNEVALASYMEMSSDESAKYIGDMLRKNLKDSAGNPITSLADIANENLLVANKALGAQAIDTKLLMFIKGGVQGVFDLTGMAATSMEKINKLEKNSQGIILKEFKLNKKNLKESLLQTDIDRTSAEDLAQIGSINNDTFEALQQLVNGSISSADFMASVKKSGAADAVFEKIETEKAKEVQAQADQAEKTFKSIVGQTLSFKEMQKIAEDEIAWRTQTLGIFKKVGEGVSDVVRWLSMRKKFETSEQKMADQQVKATNLPKWRTKEKIKKAALGGALNAIPGLGPLLSVAVAMSKEGQLSKGDVKDITSELSDKIKDTNSKLESLDQIDEKLNNVKSLTELKDIKGSTEEEKEYLKTINEYMKEGMSEDLFKAQLGINKKNAAEQKNLLTKQKSSLENNVELLTKVVNSSEELVDQYLLSKVSDKKQKDIIADLNNKMDPIDIAKKYGVSQRVISALTPKTPSFQGLRHPLTIDRPSMTATLHKGETILPRPGMITGGVNAPTGAGQKTININVNATEKDLAQRIANEIRSHLYREQLTGMA